MQKQSIFGSVFERAQPVRGRKTSRLPKITALVVTGAVGFSGLALSPVGASTANKKLTLLQQGLNYYRGKTITMLDPTAAGGGFDLEIRTLAPVMASYLGAQINVVNLTAGGGIEEMNQLAASPKDGLTLGMIENGTVLDNQIIGNSGLNFNPARLDFLGMIPTSDSIFVSQPTGPWHTMAALRSSTAANPVSVLVPEGSSSTLESQLIVDAFGIHAHFITGYVNQSAAQTGFLRGDGQVFLGSTTTTAALVAGGKATPLVQFYKLPPSDQYSATASTSIPTFSYLLKQYPPKTRLEKDAASFYNALITSLTSPLALPGRSPAADVAALSAAFEHADKSTTVKIQWNQQGRSLGFIDGTNAKKLYLVAAAAVANDHAIVDYLNKSL